MEYRNCPRCGAIFAYVSSPVCKKCEQNESDELKMLQEYVIENPGSNVSMIAQATGVSERRILKYIREERFELVLPEGEAGIECERCGKPITKGRFCDNCLAKYRKEVSSLFKGYAPSPEEPPSNEGAKMHTRYHTERRR